MNVFMSYAFTGEPHDVVTGRLEKVRDAFVKAGCEVYCLQFDPVHGDLNTGAECMQHVLKKIPSYDTVFVLNTSERRSEGMLMEVGAALILSKRIVYAQHASSVGTTYLPSLSDYTFVWDTDEQLISRIYEFSRSA